MKIFKKTLMFIIIINTLITPILNFTQTNVYAVPNSNVSSPVKIGVFFYSFNDNWLNLVKQNLEDMQKESNNQVEFIFFDAKENQTIQNQSIDSALKQKFDVFIINFADLNFDVISNTITKIAKKNIPLILYGELTKSQLDLIKSITKPVLIGSNNKQSGSLEGKVLVDVWNSNKTIIDKNNDNIMQYILLHGPSDNLAAIERTKYSILEINSAGIKTEQIDLVYCNWNKEIAKTAIESLFLRYGNQIEAIISNNDAMAIGAIEALQKYGYNNGNKEKTIAVVGIDGLPEAQDLIKKGFMTGTVYQNPHETAEAFYKIGMNLALDKDPLEDTNYTFDSTGIKINLPYYEYIPS